MLFQDLPMDLVHRIFICGSADLEQIAQSYRVYSYAINLTRVSKQWLEAAESCHALWSTISIVERRGELIPPLPVAKRWIARSGDHPLSFSIGSRLSNEENMLQALFAPHHQRWRKVDFRDSFSTAVLPDGPVNSTYPALRSLSVANRRQAVTIPKIGTALGWTSCST